MISFDFIKGNRIFSKSVVFPLVTTISLFLIGYFGYDYYGAQKELSEFQQDSDVLAIKEKNDLIKRVGELALIPQDEDPTIATVTDASRLRSQKFFSQTENGDRVIIFPRAQRAVLYRPSIDKVIESAPININDLEGTVSPTETPIESDESVVEEEVLGGDTGDTSVVVEEKPEKIEPEEPAKLAIYNGTLFIEGLATKVGAYLVKEIPGNIISVDILENADDVYEDTIIIVVAEKYYDVAETIREKLSGKIEEAPDDIDFPDVDIVIIAGTDISLNDLE